MKMLCLCFSLSIILAGCAKEMVYVVLRDVPDKPSLVVIPANDYSDEVTFANRIEASILKAGVKLITRPAIKVVTTKKGIAEAQKDNDVERAGGVEASKEERFFEYENTPADYIAFTFSETRRVKIVRKETQEVLTSFVMEVERIGSGKYQDERISNHEYQDEDKIVADALRAIGIIH